MELSYIQDCASCGAPIEATEADRVVECQYCDVRNYMVKTGPLRFALPHMIPDTVDESDILHIPYLRFKGHIYSCTGAGLHHSIVDTTQLGCSSSTLPASLGLRPQAMQIRLVAADSRGRFLKLTEQVKDIFFKAANLTTAFAAKSESPLYHRAYIGETISYIYLPTYCREGRLFDGVLNRPLAAGIDVDGLLKKASAAREQWLPRYITTICPHCAALMTAASDSLVMQCFNCESLWLEKKGRFGRMKSGFVAADRGDTYLPFWRISAELTGVKLSSFADFLRLTNHPMVIRGQHEQMEHSFWIPAFKLRPKYFLKTAKNITVSQYRIPGKSTDMPKNLYPVTMPLTEAVQSLKTVLTSAAVNKKKFMSSLPRIKTTGPRAELVYLPFHQLGQDLVQDHTSVTINGKTLYYGRTM